jgi:hypothetical protein
MNFNFEFIKNRLINLFIKPKDEWVTIKGEKSTINNLFLNYAIFLAVIPAIAGLIGYSIVGYSVGALSFRLPFFRSLIWMIFQYVFTLGSAFILGLVIDALAPSFGATKDLDSSMKISIYSLSISWVLGIFMIFPGLRMLWMLAGLYALYIMFLGLREIKTPSKDKEVTYFIAVIIISMLVSMATIFLPHMIAFGGGFGRF